MLLILSGSAFVNLLRFTGDWRSYSSRWLKFTKTASKLVVHSFKNLLLIDEKLIFIISSENYPTHITTSILNMVLGYSYSLDCDSESGKNNFVDLEEFPALTKSKPISFSGVTWKSQVFVPTEDSIESEATGNNCLNVSKKKRLKKKKKKILCSGESTDDSSPAKCCDFCFFVSEEVESTSKFTMFAYVFLYQWMQVILTVGASTFVLAFLDFIFGEFIFCSRIYIFIWLRRISS